MATSPPDLSRLKIDRESAGSPQRRTALLVLATIAALSAASWMIFFGDRPSAGLQVELGRVERTGGAAPALRASLLKPIDALRQQ